MDSHLDSAPAVLAIRKVSLRLRWSSLGRFPYKNIIYLVFIVSSIVVLCGSFSTPVLAFSYLYHISRGCLGLLTALAPSGKSFFVNVSILNLPHALGSSFSWVLGLKYPTRTITKINHIKLFRVSMIYITHDLYKKCRCVNPLIWS